MTRIISFLVVTSFAWSGLLQAGEFDCDTLVSQSMPCWISDWKTLADREVNSYGDLGDLLEDLLEGTEAGAKCFYAIPSLQELGCDTDLILKSLGEDFEAEPNDFDKIEQAWTCEEEGTEACVEPMLASTLDLIHLAEVPAVRTGAIVLSFARFMDAGDPAPWIDRYEKASIYVLTQTNDAISIATVLKMMEFYDLQDPAVADAVLPYMTHKVEWIRSLSYNRFSEYTQCPLMVEWSREEEATKEQIEAVQSWWKQQRTDNEK